MEVTSSTEEAQLVNTAMAFSTSLPIPQGQENGLLKEKYVQKGRPHTVSLHLCTLQPATQCVFLQNVLHLVLELHCYSFQLKTQQSY